MSPDGDFVFGSLAIPSEDSHYDDQVNSDRDILSHWFNNDMMDSALEDGKEAADGLVFLRNNGINVNFEDPFERLFQEADEVQWEQQTTRIELRNGATTVTKQYSRGQQDNIDAMFDPFEELMRGSTFDDESSLFFEEDIGSSRQEQDQLELVAEKEVLEALARDETFRRYYGSSGRVIVRDRMCNTLSSSASQFALLEQTFTFTGKRGKMGSCTFQVQMLQPQFQCNGRQWSTSSSSSGYSMMESSSTDLSTEVLSSEHNWQSETAAPHYQINTILVEDCMGEKWNVAIDNRADQLNRHSDQDVTCDEEIVYMVETYDCDFHEHHRRGWDNEEEWAEDSRFYIREKE